MGSDSHLENRGGVTPTRPDLGRLREGVGAHQAAAWIEHLEADIVRYRHLMRVGHGNDRYFALSGDIGDQRSRDLAADVYGLDLSPYDDLRPA